MPKRPASADLTDGDKKKEKDARRSSRKQAGFKDVGLFPSSLAPHRKKRFGINYTCDRSLKQIDKKKLKMPFFD